MSVATVRRVHVRVEGTVQGVGFRPYVYRLAGELGLAGFVLNDARGVLLEVEGAASRRRALPGPARRRGPAAGGGRARRGRGSRAGRAQRLRDRREPERRCARRTRHSRHRDLRRLPGGAVRPRATAASATRSRTAPTAGRGSRSSRVSRTTARSPRWRGFAMCSRCKAEYDDPANRRFHAQPNACPECGPSVSLVGPDGAAIAGRPGHATRCGRPRRALRGGLIVAVKGIGGYHLACRADDDVAVAALRRAKAPRGQAVRTDGGVARRRGRAGRPRLRRARAPARARPARSCSPAAARMRPSRRRSRPACRSSASCCRTPRFTTCCWRTSPRRRHTRPPRSS